MRLLRSYTEGIIRLFYPLLCKACGNEVFSADNQLCWQCHEALPYTGFEAHADNPVRHLFTGRLHLEQAYSLLYFSKESITQAVIHRFKYQGEQELARYMGRLMAQRMLQHPHWQQVDALVPLPLNKRKLKQRGYNQAQLLAEGMSQVMHVPVHNTAVLRTRYTETQTRKTRLQRWLNVEHVFDIEKEHQLHGQHVILVDDVITTGATMDAMGAVLQRVPDLRLSLASLAYASRI